MYGVLAKTQTNSPQKTDNLMASSTLSQSIFVKTESLIHLAYHNTPAKESVYETNSAVKEETDKTKALSFTHEGEKAHILFGHGLKEDDVIYFCAISLLIE